MPPPPTLLSLPSDAILRILFFLDPTFPADDQCRDPLTHGSRSWTKDADALAATCTRLTELNRSRALRCLNLSRMPNGVYPAESCSRQAPCTRKSCWHNGTYGVCCCRAATELAKRPGTTSIALGFVRHDHAEEAFAGRASAALKNVENLQLFAEPARALVADLLVSAMPNLRWLELGSGYNAHRQLHSSRLFQTTREDSFDGTVRLYERLPVRLKRLDVSRVSGRGSYTKDAIWKRLPALLELEDLDIGYIRVISDAAIPALQKCRNLRRFRVYVKADQGEVAFHPSVSKFVGSLPQGLRDLSIGTGGFDKKIHVLQGDCFSRLLELKALSLGGVNISKWDVLNPVAPLLEKLDMHGSRCLMHRRLNPCSGRRDCVPAGAPHTLGLMCNMRDITIDNFHARSVDDDAIRGLLAASKSLQKVHIRGDSLVISDDGMADAAFGAACGETLRDFDISNEVGGSGDSRVRLGDEAATAISKRFSQLTSLTLYGTNASQLGVSKLRQGCPKLVHFLVNEEALVK